MKLVVGLGNPGKKYDNTRHNMGFYFIDSYLKHKGFDVKWSNKFNGEIFLTDVFNNKVLFLKPQTFMNLSGLSVKEVVDYYHIDIDDILIVSDDLDLNLGNFKLKSSGSCGGHNGLRDIENKIGTHQFKRLKIGISKDDNYDTKDYVLGKISLDEKNTIDNEFQGLYSVMDDYFVLPFGDLMSKYNRKNN